jgi:S1-C subfamily serine protease
MRKKFTLKLLFLTPLVALLISSSAFFIMNYPTSYVNMVNFTEDTVDSFKNLFESKAVPVPAPAPLIDEEKLLSRLEKRMKKVTTTDVMTQKTALEILNATVRVTAGESIGTGVILFEKEVESIHYSYIITNNHVINNKDEVSIESFTYLKKQTISSTTLYKGRVISKDPHLDLALVQVLTPSNIGNAISFETKDIVTNLTLYQPVYIAGCALARPPFVTNGNVAHISAVSSVITAFSIFGNSGGGVYDASGKLVGIVRGVSMIQVPPRGIQIPEPNLTHMIPGPLVRSWLIVTNFSFIIDSNDCLITHLDFLDQQQALILDQQQKKAEKAKAAKEKAEKARAKAEAIKKR